MFQPPPPEHRMLDWRIEMIEGKVVLILFGIALLICLDGSQSITVAQSQKLPSQIQIERNKSLVRRWIEEGFNKRDMKVVDKIFLESLTINGHPISRDNLKQGMQYRFAAFPDLHVTVEEMIGEGDKVGIWYTAEGTQRGEFEGISATGKRATWFGFDLLQIKGGKISAGRFIDDSLGLMRQLGATLSTLPARQ